MEIDMYTKEVNLLLAGFAVDNYTLESQHEAALDHLIRLRNFDIQISILQIEGRASQTGTEPNNLTLSEYRANQVAQHLLTGGFPPIWNLEYYGSNKPIEEAAGLEIDVNRSVTIKYCIREYIPPVIEVEPDSISLPAICPEPSTYQWQISLIADIKGHAIIGGGVVFAQIGKQIQPDKFRTIIFIAFGLGVSLSSKPLKEGKKLIHLFGFGGVASVPIFEITKFETIEKGVHHCYDYKHFHLTPGTIGGVAGGAVIGASVAYVSFTSLCQGAIDIEVLSVDIGTIGLDISASGGLWYLQ